EALIQDLDIKIRDMLSPYENILELLKGVPGISTTSAENLVAEIGLDMSVFPDEKHLSSWVGIAPGNNESAGKKKVDE
ncbi:MAG: IS110 family transposase, partial [Rikenellaceae bacterium]